MHLLKRIANLFADVHARGIVHGDIKLGNVLVAPNDDLAMIDWGTASTINTQPKSDVVIGTVQFMSYEQITNEPLDGRSDIYSLGVLMTLIVYGEELTPRYTIDAHGTKHERTSDETADALALGETIKYDLLPKPRTIAEQTFQDALRCMTQWDRKLRYPTMRALVAAL
jgi:serine/threonine protein kinase